MVVGAGPGPPMCLCNCKGSSSFSPLFLVSTWQGDMKPSPSCVGAQRVYLTGKASGGPWKLLAS
jgi:hypothetical protein